MKNHKINLVLIHGAGPKHYRSLDDGSGDWQAKLVEAFSDEFNVITPQMPSLTKPNYEEWKILLEKNLAKLRTDVVFVGHSLGGSFLIKYLSEEKISQRILGLYIVSAPVHTVPGFQASADLSALTRIKNTVLYHSLDDVEVPYAQSLILQERLHAKLRTFSDRGHYFKKKPFPEIEKDIRNFSSNEIQASF